MAGLARARLAHPEWWVYTLAGSACVLLVLAHLPLESTAHVHHGNVHYGHASVSIDGDAGPTATALLVMVAAMMLPFVAPAARYVAQTSFWKRRQRAAALYVLGFSAVWASFALALFGLRATVPLVGADAGWLGATAAGAALWQGSRVRRRVAARCGAGPVVPQRGWRATRRTLEAGGAFGIRCIPLCGPPMAMMAVSSELVVMVAVFAIQVYEWRRGANPFVKRRWRVPAAAYGAIAVLAVLAAAAA